MKLQGVLGINFGESQDLVKLKMHQKGAFFHDFSDNDYLAFEGISFGGNEVEIFLFEFYNSMLCKVYIHFSNRFITLGKLFIRIRDDINSKYYKSESCFLLGFDENEIIYENLYSHNGQTVSCFWNFKNETYEEDDYITLEISGANSKCVLSYESGYLYSLKIKQKKEDNLLDY